MHRRLSAAVLVSPLAAAPALAQSVDCVANPSDPACSLGHTLHLLYWIAGGLALLLVIVVVLAIAIYRKNKTTELHPHD